MGVWAEGNFQNDEALDFVSDIADEVSNHMTPPAGFEELDRLMAAVAVLKALVENCRATCPTRADLAALKQQALRVYDAEIDEYEPKPDFKSGRRRVIEQTFDDFIALART